MNPPDILARKHPDEFLGVLYMWRGLSRIQGGAKLFSAYEVDRGTTLYAQSSRAAAPRLSSYVVACGETVRYARIEWFRVDVFVECPLIGRCEVADSTIPHAERTPR